MRILGNILWIIVLGIVFFAFFAVLGAAWCVLIIGIPFGFQCFKIAGLAIAPFGRTLETDFYSHPFINGVWIFFGGAVLWLVFAIIGVALCATLIGIPFGIQSFKIARMALRPFGARYY